MAACQPAAKAVATYLLGFHAGRHVPEEVLGTLIANIRFLTPSTVWLLQQDTFWLIKHQMIIRLKASFTVFDCFGGKIGGLIDFAASLKSPSALIDAWVRAVFRN